MCPGLTLNALACGKIGRATGKACCQAGDVKKSGITAFQKGAVIKGMSVDTQPHPRRTSWAHLFKMPMKIV